MDTNELKREVLLDILIEKLKEIEEETEDNYTSMISKGELDYNLLAIERKHLKQRKNHYTKSLLIKIQVNGLNNARRN